MPKKSSGTGGKGKALGHTKGGTHDHSQKRPAKQTMHNHAC